MYKNRIYGVDISIELENGIYGFNTMSATGKTRLCKLLREVEKKNGDVIGYTFEDKNLGIDLRSQVKKLNPKVIILDRLDMYPEEFMQDIQEWGKTAIVLLDYKGSANFNEDWCYIKMTSSSIEVNQ